MHACSIVASLLIITQQPFNTVRAACLSKEQFVASLDQKRTLVFEAVLLQNTAGLPHSDGFQAYVQITKVIQQPGIGWHLTPGSVAKIKGIRPRSVDYTLCLPQPVNGETYLWVTWSNTRGIQNTEGALMFYPGGLFYWETTKQNKLIAGQGPSPNANRTRTPNATISGYDLLQHDAPRQFSMYGQHATNSLGAINSGVCDVTPCPIEHRPVCGTDGVLYLNKCLLEQEACKKKRGPIGDGSAFVSIRIDYSGKCMQQNNGGYSPCEAHKCRRTGERCEVDRTGKPKCVCPESCPAVMLPVCGNDGVTYESHCHLERTACLKKRDVWVIYAGQCSFELQCQALGLRCQGYEICSRSYIPQVYGRQSTVQTERNGASLGLLHQPTIARCICPVCPEKGLGKNVCGTDGHTYMSECHLRARACQAQVTDLTVAMRGSCDACRQMNCKYYAKCQPNLDGKPQCVCPTDCPSFGTVRNVCGTDKKTYDNECLMRVQSCAEQKEVRVFQEGPCRACPFGCPLGQLCFNGECVCRDGCPKSIGPEPEVCGSDGNVYRSECEMKRQGCIQRKTIEVDPTGLTCNKLVKADKLDNHVGILPQSDEISPHHCNCNKLGSLSEQCDYNGQCSCMQLVRGKRCDQCTTGYWGIQNGHECIDCSCHPDGSMNNACDQLTGQCTCKPGVLGRQCSICQSGEQLTKDGCAFDVESEVSSERIRSPQMATAGRLFSPKTTLLIRALVTLEQPVAIELHATLYATDGGLLYYRVSPTTREQMMVPNIHDHQFSLMVARKRLECRYVNGSTRTRVHIVRSALTILPGAHYKIHTGVSNGQPWLRINNEDQTVSYPSGAKVEHEKTEEILHSGGYRTIVVGRPLTENIGGIDTIQGSYTNVGFSGCLLKLVIRAGNPALQQVVDLIKADHTEMVWIGIQQMQSGLDEAPLCEPPYSANQRDSAKGIQSDSIGPEWKTDPCMWSRPVCQNKGLCKPSDSGDYFCICQPGWQGKHCEQMATIVPQFFGHSFIRLPGPSGEQSMQRKRLLIELIFIITELPGLLFFVPPDQFSNRNPFIAAYVDSQSYLVIVCRVGIRDITNSFAATESHRHSNIIRLRYSVPVQVGHWYTLTIDKRSKRISVTLDGKVKEQMRLVPLILKKPNQKLFTFDISKSPIYLGGFPFPLIPTSVISIKKGLVGAIQKIIINGAELVLADPTYPSSSSIETLLRWDNTEYWSNVSQWQGPPCGPSYNPCLMNPPENVCRPQGSEAVCSCSTPLQLWSIIHERMDYDVERAEKLACDQRQRELLTAKVESSLSRQTYSVQNDGQALWDPLILGTSEPVDRISEQVCGSLVVRFAGSTIFRFEEFTNAKENYRIHIKMKSPDRDGMILYLGEDRAGRFGRHANDRHESIIIAMKNGLVEVAIHSLESDRMANNSAAIRKHRTKTRVNDNKCHNVWFARNKRSFTFGVDNEAVTGEAQRHPSRRHKNKYIMLGGATTEVKGIPLEYQQNFTGCIGDFVINDRQMQVLTDAYEIWGPVMAC